MKKARDHASILQLLGLVGSLGGCAGVYAEVAATHMASGEIVPSTGPSTTVGGSIVGFNVGLELGTLSKRFAFGYVHDSVSYDQGSAGFAGTQMRGDFNLLSLADRLKLRLALGVEFGNGSSTYAGMSHPSGGGGGAFAGLDATYYLTWTNAIHVMVGGRYFTEQAPTGSYAGTGVTFRATISHTFGDVRPDQTFVIPLSNSPDILHEMDAGATAIGCVTTDQEHRSTMAMLDVTCPGSRHVSFFQMADGMMVTCAHETSESSCRGLSEQIAASASKTMKQAEPAPPPAPPAPPAPPPPPADPAPQVAP